MSLLKWVGGKKQIMKSIMLYLKMKEKTIYYEPFVGGGSVLLEVISLNVKQNDKKCEKIYASDINKHLIEFYQCIQNDQTLPLFKKSFLQLQNEYNQLENMTLKGELFYNCREKYNTISRNTLNRDKNNVRGNDVGEMNIVEKSVLFLFLNRTCFRGLYREGPNGFNTPFGNYKTIAITEEQIENFHNTIQNVIFTCQDFEKSFSQIFSMEENSCVKKVYLDPPYFPVKENSFVNYQKSGFTLQQHEKLFSLCKECTEKKIHFVLSNAYVEKIVNDFSKIHYTIEIVECRRQIHAKNPNSKTKELIISNKLI